MSGFVFTFCVFPTSLDACYSGLLPEILQAMLEWPKLGFYPKLCVDLVDLSNREQKRQKAKTDIFTGTPFIFNCYFIFFYYELQFYTFHMVYD